MPLGSLAGLWVEGLGSLALLWGEGLDSLAGLWVEGLGSLAGLLGYVFIIHCLIHCLSHCLAHCYSLPLASGSGTHSFSLFNCSSSSGVNSLVILKVARIASGPLPWINLATALSNVSNMGGMSM